MIKQNCDKRLITLYRLRICLAGAVFLILIAAAVLLFAGPGPAPILFAVILSSGIFVPAAALLPRYWYDRFSYTRHTGWLMIEYGIIRSRCIMVPRSCVQYISVRRSFLERRLGLCTLELSSGGSVIRLPGMAPDEAGRMKTLLEGWNGYRHAV